ncbi:MAG: MBL fold metallo-hydrolase [Actinomycetales bacterium]|nr:MBL fold metallo-hydrolase [Actinomycetales bacterium]
MAAPIVLLAPGVYRIPTLGDYINAFAFVDADGQVTLVDCGLARAPRRIVAALAGIGKRPSDVTRIILTHAHGDHAGGAHELVTRAGTEGVDVHADDAPYIRAGTSAPWGNPTAGRLLGRGPTARFTATPVVTELHDGQVIDVAGGLRVLHTPGHTPGHVSLLHEESGVLITGDAIFNMGARMRWPLAAVCTSAHLNQRSAHVLGEVEYSVAAFTHGPEIRDDARERIRGFLMRGSR